jgi:DNA-binding response OmpR family regulator
MTHSRCEAEYCPTCGAPRDRTGQLERFGLRLEQRWVDYQGAGPRHVPEGLAAVLGLLLLRGRASHEALMMALGGEATVDENVKVRICYLRKLLGELTGGAVIIRTLHSFGYQLESAGEERAAA